MEREERLERLENLLEELRTQKDVAEKCYRMLEWESPVLEDGECVEINRSKEEAIEKISDVLYNLEEKITEVEEEIEEIEEEEF